MEAKTMKWLTIGKPLALAALLDGAIALGTAPHVAAQDTGDAATMSSVSPAPAAAAPAPRPVEQPARQPALDNAPEPGDAFPTAPWGNTE
jgi:hypothetical protein